MDTKTFFDTIRPKLFPAGMAQSQVAGFTTIVDQASARGVPLLFLAYMLATAYHETAKTMQPIAEYGHGKGRSYGIPDGPYGNVYYGRGYVQLTWLKNYVKAGKAVGVDLEQFPEKALDPAVAAQVMFDGMIEGWFTGRKLADYLTGGKKDYVNARRIINGTDKAELIAGDAVVLEGALSSAGYAAQAVPASPAPTSAPTPQNAPVAKPASKTSVPAAAGAAIAVASAGGLVTYWHEFTHWIGSFF